MKHDKSYHNTTNESGEQVDMFENKANKQEVIIMELFRRHHKLTASGCFQLYPDRTIPLTSIRRGISNLTRQGKLLKLDGENPEKRMGIYGRMEYVYEII
jgi:hypothetical protein